MLLESQVCCRVNICKVKMVASVCGFPDAALGSLRKGAKFSCTCQLEMVAARTVCGSRDITHHLYKRLRD